MLTNNGSTIENINKEIVGNNLKIAVNSVQRTLHVERLSVNIAYPADRIIPYDNDNLYPNKVKAIAMRSGTTMSAIKTQANFLSGDGFIQMKTVVNSEKQTLWDILRHIAMSKSWFFGYALHFNYNMLGQISSITPVNFETIRWHKSLQKFVYNPDWGKRYIFRKNEIEYMPFNPAPEIVYKQIEAAGGIEKYNGQILYWIPNINDYYTVCNFDDVIDDAQFEAEVKLYSLSSVQNDYSLSGIISYPKNIESTEGKEKVQKELKGDTGSGNAGGIRVVPAPVIEEFKNWKWFTPISRNNIDGLHTNQIERARDNIYASFRQPPILNGVSKDGMFNESSFADAFNYYNSATETERKEIESELNKIIAKSIWANIGEIQIQPKTYVTRESKNTGTGIQTEPQANEEKPELNETLTNLTGRQLQGVFRITKKYKKGELTKDQAILMLKQGFGFDDEQCEVWLINDDENGGDSINNN